VEGEEDVRVLGHPGLDRVHFRGEDVIEILVHVVGYVGMLGFCFLSIKHLDDIYCKALCADDVIKNLSTTVVRTCRFRARTTIILSIVAPSLNTVC
jgi:hypothetical protein